MTDRICDNCRDAVMYCTCYVGEDRDLSDSGEFQILSPTGLATWNPSNRMLTGDQVTIDAILDQLSDRKETICDVGTLWMEQREPIAVAFTAEGLGFELSGDVPEWGFIRE